MDKAPEDTELLVIDTSGPQTVVIDTPGKYQLKGEAIISVQEDILRERDALRSRVAELEEQTCILRQAINEIQTRRGKSKLFKEAVAIIQADAIKGAVEYAMKNFHENPDKTMRMSDVILERAEQIREGRDG